MRERFYGAIDAAEYAAEKADRWLDEGEDLCTKDDVLSYMSGAEDENPLDEDDDQTYYVVEDDGTIGYTTNAEETIYWIFKPVAAKSSSRKSSASKAPEEKPAEEARVNNLQVGYSQKLYSPEFQTAIKKSKRSNFGCAIYAIAAPIPFLVICSFFNDEYAISDAVTFGAVLSAIIFVVCLFIKATTIFDSAWDGVVVEKEQKKERRERRHGNRLETEWVPHFYVTVRKDNGGKKVIDSDTAYFYFKKGERLRHHAKMGFVFPYEKYDKTKDNDVVCPFCGMRVAVTEDYCTKCKNPLLK